MDKANFEHPQAQSHQPAFGQIAGTPDLTAQLQAAIARITALENKRINFNTDLIGLFETVTAAPTLTPNNPYDQIKISVITGTTALNVYDAANHVWKSVTLT